MVKLFALLKNGCQFCNFHFHLKIFSNRSKIEHKKSITKMDSICLELGIPRKQIKETKYQDRYILLAHKSWLHCLIKYKKLIDFPIFMGLEEWPSNDAVNEYSSWTTIYINVIEN